MKRMLLISLFAATACGPCDDTPAEGEPWELWEVEPDPPGGTGPVAVDCDAFEFPSCNDSCVVDVEAGSSDCDFDIEWSQSRFEIRMPSADSRLLLTAIVCDPEGWTLHVGDSPSNNGFGGDAAQFTNDAELQIVDTDIIVYGSDRSVDSPDHVREYPATFSATGCAQIDLLIGDGTLFIGPACVEEENPDLFRLDADDREGESDRRWFVGMNRTYASSGRAGSGLRQLGVCIVEP